MGMSEKKYISGQLVRIVIKDRYFTPDGFATVGTGLVFRKGIFDAQIFNEIDLGSFPSHDDFRGEMTVVNDGDLATVISFKGRPESINSDPQWACYDVYEILADGCIRNIFRYNIEAIPDDGFDFLQKPLALLGDPVNQFLRVVIMFPHYIALFAQ